MIKIISDPLVKDWMCRRLATIGDKRQPSDFGKFSKAIGVVKMATDGPKPIAGIVFHDFRELPHGNDVQATFAVEPGARATKKEIFTPLFDYCFNRAKCARITLAISEANKPSQRLVRNLGFRKEGVLRKGYNGKTNAIIFGILRDEARKNGWIE